MAGFVKGFNPVRISGSAEWAGSSVWYADEHGQAEECPVCKPVDGLDSGRPRVQIPPGPPNYRQPDGKILPFALDCLFRVVPWHGTEQISIVFFEAPLPFLMKLRARDLLTRSFFSARRFRSERCQKSSALSSISLHGNEMFPPV